MNSKSVIIIPNELNTPMPLFAKNCVNHVVGLTEFIYQSGVSLSQATITNQEINLELGEQGYVVMLHDKTEINNNLAIFLPLTISPKQFEWFKKREKGLESYDLMIMNNVDNKIWEPIDSTTTDKPIISELFRVLNEKYIIEENNQIKTRTYKKED